MPDAISSTQLILLTSILGVLLLLALILTRISNNLTRVSRHLNEVTKRIENSAQNKSETRRESLGAYEQFLNEDPERLKLSKKERFSLYRVWRKEKGLNWSTSRSGSVPQG